MVFDLLMINGKGTTSLPLVDRKAKLQKLLTPIPDNLLFVQHFEGQSIEPFHKFVLPMELEGMVGKRRDSIYLPGARSRDWVKIKRPGAVPVERFKR
jgi:bifunctional non-homologous end joining protein LigD